MTSLPAEIDPALAAGMLRDWGFLAHSDLPDAAGPSWLLVAIRPQPTLRHYDPEQVTYWVAEAGHGAAAVLDRTARLPLDRQTTWGQLRVTDRLRVTNEWLSFGGRLVADRVDGAAIAVFSSPAPLLRMGGHSQGWDDGAANLAAFFARVRALAGADARFEARTLAADPVARYACFVEDALRRYRVSEVLRSLHPDLVRVLGHEAHRLRETHGAEWEAGMHLLAAVDAASTGALMGDQAAV